MKRTPNAAVLLAAVALLGAAACGSGSKPGSSGSTAAPTGKALKGTLTVLAASSLTKGLGALADEFTAANPGAKVTTSFGGSSDLVNQIEQGAPADVFASADQKNMQKLVDRQLLDGSPQDVVKNKLEIAVEKGNPKHIATLADLAKSGVVVVLCDASVPCGSFADQVLARAKVTVSPKSREANVKATLSKVELGEADAAVVYTSDVASSGKVDGVPIPDDQNAFTTLPIAVIKSTGNATLAKAFVDFVVAHRDELVAKYGFLPL